MQNRIPTCDGLISKGIQVPSFCLLCNTNDESRDHLYWECDFAFELWRLVAGRCRSMPDRRWENSLDQMLSLPPPTTTRSLILLGLQAIIYWIWNERNNRLHANQLWSVDSLFSIIDNQIRKEIQSSRDANPKRSLAMMQQWIRWAKEHINKTLLRFPSESSSPNYVASPLPTSLIQNINNLTTLKRNPNFHTFHESNLIKFYTFLPSSIRINHINLILRREIHWLRNKRWVLQQKKLLPNQIRFRRSLNHFWNRSNNASITWRCMINHYRYAIFRKRTKLHRIIPANSSAGTWIAELSLLHSVLEFKMFGIRIPLLIVLSLTRNRYTNKPTFSLDVILQLLI